MKSIGRLWPQYLPVPKNGESNEPPLRIMMRSEEHTSELQSQSNLVCRLLLEKKKKHPMLTHHLDVQRDGQRCLASLKVAIADGEPQEEEERRDAKDQRHADERS